MADFIYQVVAEHNIYPNITVCKTLMNGVQTGWRVTPNDGYVFYDTTDEYTEFNPETEEDVPVRRYFTIAYLPLIYNWDNFGYVAVLRSEITSESEVL